MASFASTEATWTKKLNENNGQLRFHPPPQVEHESRLDKSQLKQWPAMLPSSTTGGARKPTLNQHGQ